MDDTICDYCPLHIFFLCFNGRKNIHTIGLLKNENHFQNPLIDEIQKIQPTLQLIFEEFNPVIVRVTCKS